MIKEENMTAQKISSFSGNLDKDFGNFPVIRQKRIKNAAPTSMRTSVTTNGVTPSGAIA